MGISYKYGQLQLWQDFCHQEHIVLAGLRMAELGNQRIPTRLLEIDCCEQVAAKHIFGLMGVEHTSFDLNGRDGAVPIDLAQPIPDKWRGTFDVVTNFGTSEHVTNQYQCWQNIHDLCRVGGWMLHGLPEVGSWTNVHCEYLYTLDNTVALANACDYTVLIARRYEHVGTDSYTRHCVMLCFRRGAREFPDEPTFMQAMFSDKISE